MKKCLIFVLLCVGFTVGINAERTDCEYLASAVAAAVGDEPFAVKVAYAEMLLNRQKNERFPNTLPALLYAMNNQERIPLAKASESDFRAAVAAAGGFGFAGDALYAKKQGEVKNTPLVLRSGVRFYDWFFYS